MVFSDERRITPDEWLTFSKTTLRLPLRSTSPVTTRHSLIA